LPLASLDETPPAAALFGAATVMPQPLTLERLSLCLELSLDGRCHRPCRD
jgi:hypothetical protein